MADKVSSGIRGTAIAASGVVTSGTISADRVNVVFDEALSSAECMELLQKAADQVAAYYLKR